jgi:hypothetical protein
MRRVRQQQKVAVDERGIRLPESRGDCYPACVASIFELPLEKVPGLGGNTQAVFDWMALNYPGIGLRSRTWVEPRDEPEYHAGFWIATVLSSRFREADCSYCRPDTETSDPPWFWRRDECPACEGSGEMRGLHAIVMENRDVAWDPHPDADGSPYRYCGEDFFIVTDPSRLAARPLPA